MLDATNPKGTTSSTWKEALRHGDIVAFRFPVPGDSRGGAPDVRPCLVLDVKRLAGRTFALLAYGVTARRIRNKDAEVDVIRRSDHRAAGLLRPTRFVGEMRIFVTLDNPGFEPRDETGSPLMGRLRNQPLERLREVRARLHALSDARADGRRRGGRPTGRRRSARRGIDFAVEVRGRPRRVRHHLGAAG
ncbi:hypothetical protein [Tranquillimonas alkanivorans]|nr:hypothetical protein [Tranquillimonas alkanivorans]